MKRLKILAIVSVIMLVLCSCTNKIEYTDVPYENGNFLISLDEACLRVESSGYLDDILIEKLSLDSMVWYKLKDNIDLRILGDKEKSRFAIDAPKEQSSSSIIGNSLGAVFLTVYPSGFIDNDYTDVVYEIAKPIDSGKNEKIPVYYKHLRILCDVERDNTTLIISPDGDKKPEKDLPSGNTPTKLVTIKESEKDVDSIYNKAKKDSENATVESVTYALNYIIDNYDNFYEDAETMERIMYYGYYLDIVCRDRNMTYQELGNNAVDSVKDVYRNFETQLDNYSLTNYQQVAELIDRIS